MTLVLIAKNDLYQKTLEKAFSLLGEEIHSYSGIGDVTCHGGSEIAVCLLEGQEHKVVRKLTTKIPVFVILPPQNNIDEEFLVDFTAVFYAPLRLGKIVEAVRIYKRQKIQKEKLSAITIGKYSLDPKNSCLVVEGVSTPIRLTEREQDILLYLYNHQGQSVSRQELLDHVWGYADGVETHTLETHIYRLRQKIEADPSTPNFLMTNDDGYYLEF